MLTLRDAFRSLRATPLLTGAVMVSLALGIGATTALFTLLNSLLLKPLPVRAPYELVAVSTASNPDEAMSISYPVWRQLRERRLLDGAFAWAQDRVGLSDTGEVRFAHAVWATGNFFEVLGVSAARGRTLRPDDDRRESDDPVAVISFAMWQRQFGGAADIIGRRLTIERVPFTIVGVTPPEFFGLNVGATFDVVLPLEAEPRLARRPKRLELPTWTWLQVMARRRPEQTTESLTTALAAAHPLIRAATMPPLPRAEDRDAYMRAPWQVRDAPAGVSRMRGQYAPTLWVLLAVVAAVLLIACANIASLMRERALRRRGEFGVRLSLGATRWDLVRMMFTESVAMAMVAGGAGLILAGWASRLVVSLLSTWASTPSFDLSLDWRVLAISAGVTMTTAIVAGGVPALFAAQANPLVTISQNAKHVLPGGTTSIRALPLLGQVALSLVLVVAAGLFLRSFVALAYRDLGFDRGRVLVAAIDAQRSTVPAAGRLGMLERLRATVASLPDVESAALSMATPLGSAGVRFTPAITIPGVVMPAEGTRVLTNPVSPGWFSTYGTRLLRGRDFGDRDREGAAPVVIVNEAFAARYFSGTDPIGRTITELVTPSERRALEVVGVVQNAAFVSVRDPMEPTMYAPLEQRVDADRLVATMVMTLCVRARHGSPARLTTQIAGAVAGIDRALAVSFLTLDQQLDAFYVRERVLAWLSGFFGIFAVLLAALGLYASISHAVSRRRSEIAIRIVLGAQPREVRRHVLQRVMFVVAGGLAIGAIGSWWSSRLIGSLLYDVEARDPLTFIVGCLVLLGAAVTAGWLPARRATRVDPASILREG
jgi:putative ABC transport system permease protein